MNIRLLRGLAGATSLALLATALLGGTVNAANPTWDIITIPIPDKVGAGHDAGFIVTVVNNGPSNINDMRVTLTTKDTPTSAPTYVSDLVYRIDGVLTGETTTCSPAGVPLTCLLGTLEDDESVTFTVAYLVTPGLTGAFDLNVAIRAGTGDPEGNNNSRGDKYNEDAFATIGSGNFDGGFVVGQDSYQTNPAIGKKNVQATGLSGAPQLVPVTILDGPTITATCDPLVEATCATLFGEWSELHVNNGNGGVPFTAAFKVTLLVYGSAVPGGVQTEDIRAVHVLDNGTIKVLDQNCVFDGTAPEPNAECIVVTKIGSNWKIEAYLFQNGSIKGGF